jgi:hypothetical protein
MRPAVNCVSTNHETEPAQALSAPLCLYYTEEIVDDFLRQQETNRKGRPRPRCSTGLVNTNNTASLTLKLALVRAGVNDTMSLRRDTHYARDVIVQLPPATQELAWGLGWAASQTIEADD